jgi:hypothetical protein
VDVGLEGGDTEELILAARTKKPSFTISSFST